MAPVYVDGKLKCTLRGDAIVAEFIVILNNYVASGITQRPRKPSTPDLQGGEQRESGAGCETGAAVDYRRCMGRLTIDPQLYKLPHYGSVGGLIYCPRNRPVLASTNTDQSAAETDWPQNTRQAGSGKREVDSRIKFT